MSGGIHANFRMEGTLWGERFLDNKGLAICSMFVFLKKKELER